jgi:hypothetical protein
VNFCFIYLIFAFFISVCEKSQKKGRISIKPKIEIVKVENCVIVKVAIHVSINPELCNCESELRK